MPPATKTKPVNAKAIPSKKVKPPKPGTAAKVVDLGNGREVLYPKPKAVVHDEENPLTVKKAMELLRWTEETADEKFGQNYLFVDIVGKKVWCKNNITNRPFYQANCDRLRQDILNKLWELNGEAVIIGRTGLVLNGQHTLIALVLAEQERLHGKDAEYWQTMWPDEICISKVIVYGINEEDKTVNTMDTCKLRSFADVIYRSKIFNKMPPAERAQASKLLQYSVKVMWDRTHAKADPYSPLMTFPEGMEFIERHPGLVEAIKHIVGEGVEKLDSYKFGGGLAAALLYLMGASASDPKLYRADRQESVLDLSQWDAATEFWTGIMGKWKNFTGLVQAFSAHCDYTTGTGGNGTTAEKIGALIKAWGVWIETKGKGTITYEDVELEYSKDPKNEGQLVLVEHPVLGGIDFGRKEDDIDPPAEGNGLPSSAEPESEDEIDVDSTDAEQLETAKEKTLKIREARADKLKAEELAKKAAGAIPTDHVGLLKYHMSRLKHEHDSPILFFATPGFDPPIYQLWEADAVAYAKVTKQVTTQDKATAMYRMKVTPEQIQGAVNKLWDIGERKSAIVTGAGSADDPWVVTPLTPQGTTPAPKAASPQAAESSAPTSTNRAQPGANGAKPTPRPGSVKPGLRGGTGK